MQNLTDPWGNPAKFTQGNLWRKNKNTLKKKLFCNPYPNGNRTQKVFNMKKSGGLREATPEEIRGPRSGGADMNCNMAQMVHDAYIFQELEMEACDWKIMSVNELRDSTGELRNTESVASEAESWLGDVSVVLIRKSNTIHTEPSTSLWSVIQAHAVTRVKVTETTRITARRTNHQL